eukprot:1186183-Prorocentrum_minimum.AAC.1
MPQIYSCVFCRWMLVLYCSLNKNSQAVPACAPDIHPPGALASLLRSWMLRWVRSNRRTVSDAAIRWSTASESGGNQNRLLRFRPHAPPFSRGAFERGRQRWGPASVLRNSADDGIVGGARTRARPCAETRVASSNIVHAYAPALAQANRFTRSFVDF